MANDKIEDGQRLLTEEERQRIRDVLDGSVILGLPEDMYPTLMGDTDFQRKPKHAKTEPISELRMLMQPAVWVEVTGEQSATYEFQNIPTNQANTIVRELLAPMLERFLSKNADYGDCFDGMSLGPKAEFVRMWNKFGKLKQVLWDGKTLEYEQVTEVLDDLLGHILLARFGLMNPSDKVD